MSIFAQPEAETRVSRPCLLQKSVAACCLYPGIGGSASMGQVVFEPDARISRALFNTTCIMAPCVELESGISGTELYRGNEGDSMGTAPVVGFRERAGHGDRAKTRL